MFVKIGDSLNLKLSSGLSREQALLRKSRTPRESPEKWTFLSLAFYNVEFSLFSGNFSGLWLPRDCCIGRRERRGGRWATQDHAHSHGPPSASCRPSQGGPLINDVSAAVRVRFFRSENLKHPSVLK